MSKRTSTRLNRQAIDDAPARSTIWDSEIPGFGLRVTAAGSKSFVFQFRALSGEQGKLTIGRYPSMTVDEARKVARKHRVSVDNGGNPSLDRKTARQAASVSDYAAIYLGPYAKKKELSATTVQEAQRALSKYVLPKFGSRKLETIRTSEISSLMATVNELSGRGQANRVKAVLSKMFNLAILDQVVSFNPCRAVENYRIERRWDHLSPSQAAILLAACDDYHDQTAANVVRLLMFTGARLREVLKAEWAQFDLEAGVWTKPSAHTKSKRVHRLALPEEAVCIIRTMQQDPPSERWLFPGRDTTKHRADFKRPWTAILSLARIGHWRCHDLRRTTASIMLSEGEDISVIGKTLGHTQMQTTLSYSFLNAETQRRGLTRAVAAMRSGGTTPATIVGKVHAGSIAGDRLAHTL